MTFAGNFSLIAKGTDHPPRYPTVYSHEIHGLREAPIPVGERGAPVLTPR